MKQQLDLQKHIEDTVEEIVTDIIKATLKNPKEGAFMARFLLASRKASMHAAPMRAAVSASLDRIRVFRKLPSGSAETSRHGARSTLIPAKRSPSAIVENCSAARSGSFFLPSERALYSDRSQ